MGLGKTLLSPTLPLVVTCQSLFIDSMRLYMCNISYVLGHNSVITEFVVGYNVTPCVSNNIVSIAVCWFLSKLLESFKLQWTL